SSQTQVGQPFRGLAFFVTAAACRLHDDVLPYATRVVEDRGMRVLVVEDDDRTASYMAKGLGESGHVVDRAADGHEGLFLASENAYDAIVLDRMLPKLDGLGVLQALRASKVTTPVLILSALAQVDDRVAGLRAGGDDYLTKPFAFSELM